MINNRLDIVKKNNNGYILKLFIIIVFLCYLSMKRVDLDIIFSLILLSLFMDLNELFSIKNYYNVYTFLLFQVAGKILFHKRLDLSIDYYLYFFSFNLAYIVMKILVKNKVKITYYKVNKLKTEKQIYVFFEKLLFIFILFDFLNLMRIICSVGLVNFYTGKLLVEQISSYGKKNIVGGLLSIISSLVSGFKLGLMIHYIRFSFVNGYKINKLILYFNFVLMPILALQRAQLAFGALFITFLNDYFKKRNSKMILRIMILLLLIIFSSSYIGNIRERALTGEKQNYTIDTVKRIIIGEFTGIVAYTEIKDNIKILNYQYGKTLMLPFVLKPIPRSIFPSKPWNSSGYYMYKIRENQAKDGFFLAPSIFGDFYLNFGYVGTIFLSLILGIVSYKLDSIHRSKIKSYHYIIIFYLFYTLMRSNFSDTLFTILQIYIPYLVIKKILPFKEIIRRE